MINTKTNLRHRIMAVRFAIWDLHLYLDTHMGDCTAMELIEKYKKKLCELMDEYTCQYGPLSIKDENADKWLCTPFPWVNSGSDC